jgi:hypothetical protein
MIYYEDSRTQIRLFCPSLCPKYSEDYVGQANVDHDLETRSAYAYSLISPCLVSALWVEEAEDFISIPSKLQASAMVYLVIQPMRQVASNGLYRVRILVVDMDAISNCVLVRCRFDR